MRVLLSEGLFTSGIKSAYDIETSGWMELSQGTGARTTGLQTTKMKLYKESITRFKKNH